MADILTKKFYRRVFIAEDRNDWPAFEGQYDVGEDLVLTFDHALRRAIRARGGEAHYIDHLANAEELQKLNFKTYDFFSRWYRDETGQDQFTYKGYNIGASLRIELWNEITDHARLVFSLRELKGRTNQILFSSDNARLARVLAALLLPVTTLPTVSPRPNPGYFFPIHRWNAEQLSKVPRNLKSLFRSLFSPSLDLFTRLADLFSSKARPLVYLNHYHPLAPVFSVLKRQGHCRVVSDKYIKAWDVFRQRRLPLVDQTVAHRAETARLIKDFRRVTVWVEEGVDVADLVMAPLLSRAAAILPRCLQVIDSIEAYFKTRSLNLMVTFTNLGVVNALMTEFCRKKGIPVYLVINGLLANSFLDEAKEATLINAYGPAIKKNYFQEKPNVVCLGDPRMDAYPPKPRVAIRSPLRIVVGTAGFNNLDLNSYLAYEFDFIDGVLSACQRVTKEGLSVSLALKVRANGYASSYRAFLQEYYPGWNVKIIHNVPMRSVLRDADLYISTYSQTLFEASACGIPAIFFKADTEREMHPPFDGKSELITACNVAELTDRIRSAAAGSSEFNTFLDRQNMEQYVGPLDGGALRRNLEQIQALIAQGQRPIA